MITALVQVDDASGETWLSFPSMPPPDVRASLKSTGWVYDSGLRSWRHPARSPSLPRGVTYAQGHGCAYSQLGPARTDEILEILKRAKAAAKRSR